MVGRREPVDRLFVATHLAEDLSLPQCVLQYADALRSSQSVLAIMSS